MKTASLDNKAWLVLGFFLPSFGSIGFKFQTSAASEERRDRCSAEKKQRSQRLLLRSVFDSVINYCTAAAAVVVNKSQQLTNCRAPSLALIQRPLQHIEL